MSDFGAFSSGDPTADFLARERAILGDDADFVTGAADAPAAAATTSAADLHPEMAAFPPLDALGSESAAAFAAAPAPDANAAGLFDMPFAAPVPVTAASAAPLGGAFAGAAAAAVPLPGSPANVPPMMDAGMFGSPATPTPLSAAGGPSTTSLPEIDPEPIRKWREEFQQTIAERDAAEARVKQETMDKAKRDIDKFYEEYNAKRERALQDNKALQDALLTDLNDTVSGTFWERVIKNIELVSGGNATGTDGVSANPTGASGASGVKLTSNVSITKKAANGGSQKDVTRFKQVLIALKADKNTAPGA
ncbi:hypothetical protein GGF32_002956 [Allomyces javanicus]|nr:hypothetical protein GGF32_002956 [Allomyces javanicus]